MLQRDRTLAHAPVKTHVSAFAHTSAASAGPDVNQNARFTCVYPLGAANPGTAMPPAILLGGHHAVSLSMYTVTFALPFASRAAAVAGAAITEGAAAATTTASSATTTAEAAHARHLEAAIAAGSFKASAVGSSSGRQRRAKQRIAAIPEGALKHHCSHKDLPGRATKEIKTEKVTKNGELAQMVNCVGRVP